MPDEVKEDLTRDQRPFLHPESLQIFRFTASPLQFTHSSSTGFRSENTWHEIRDHSFIQNHSRSSDSQLLLFSSPHSSSTGFRSENTWHEIRDHSFIQNHSRSSDSQLLLFSSPHSSSTGFRSENWNGQQKLGLVSIWYNPWCHVSKQDVQTSSRNIGPQHKQYSSIFHCTHEVLFYPCVHQTHLECLLLKSYFLGPDWLNGENYRYSTIT